MNSILKKTINEIEIKKSRFIAVACPVNEESEIQDLLKSLKKDYVGASHYTYAYTLGDTGNIQKASDDGEPTRTAGFPILEVISKNNLTNIIIVVIRYFGGTLLGAGGLIRAYSSSASEVIKLVTLTKKITTYECIVTCSYDNLGNIDRYLRENTNLINVAYDSEITFTFKINALDFEEVKSQLFNKNSYEDKLTVVNETSEYA
ncbi:YigZ family protein [Candidatus Izemoplasma sp. B36]|uniref:YigZ family protein n=1 Tax=Candidatus Izemoplasma sp. B36 TaxID=3242468 RepID=UPI0035582E21